MSVQIFKFGNHLIQREITIMDGVPKKSVITDLKTGYTWSTGDYKPLIAFGEFDFTGCDVTISHGSITFEMPDFSVVWEHFAYDGLPVIKTRIGIKGKPIADKSEAACASTGVESSAGNNKAKDIIECVGSLSNHVDITTLNFYDCTDNRTHLVDKNTSVLYNCWGIDKFDGQVFSLCERLTKNELLVVKEAPTAVAHLNKNCPDLVSNPIQYIHVCASGVDLYDINENEYTYAYPVVVGLPCKEGWEQLFRDYFCAEYIKKPTYIMSNTWGDRNNDMRVSEAFVMREIEYACKMGIDIVQIDDGWQTGVTANSKLKKGGVWGDGYRASQPDFWEVNREKFPHGLDKLVQYANEKNVKLGLWFSPDGTNDYADWSLDAETLLDFYNKYGIKYFKLDGIGVKNRKCEENIRKMLDEVLRKSDGNVTFNMDITAGKRFGYLSHHDVGDLFVENRYTDFASYYPYRTMHNLWRLSKYFPTSRMQFEVLNIRRNADKYNDILAPDNYDMDFVFASVMVANPLLWCELQNLDEESQNKLSEIIKVYKLYREDFVDVRPILNAPDGLSLTGFYINGKKNNYVVVIRDQGQEDTVCGYNVKQVLATNDDGLQISPVRFSKKKAYLFAVAH